MKIRAKVGLGVAAAAALVTIGAAVFVASGVYNIGADDHHTKLVLAIIEELRERSIAARSDSIAVPQLEDPSKIAAGAIWYSTLCVGCHLAPGVTRSRSSQGSLPTSAQSGGGGYARFAPGFLDHQARHQDERYARMGHYFGRCGNLGHRGLCSPDADDDRRNLPAALETRDQGDRPKRCLSSRNIASHRWGSKAGSMRAKGVNRAS